MLQNKYLDAKIGVDRAENEPRKECCVLAGISLLQRTVAGAPVDAEGGVQVGGVLGCTPRGQPPFAAAGEARGGLVQPRHITLSEARSRLDQRRFWRPNTHFAAFFELYKICGLCTAPNSKILEIFVIKKRKKVENFF